MEIIIRDSADIPHKYLRYAKWKIRKIANKFSDLIYVEIYISKEGQSFTEYQSVFKLGVKGDDIVLKTKASNLEELWKDSLRKADRYLRKHKEKTKSH